jgi:nucleoside-triphosphatase THEP1
MTVHHILITGLPGIGKTMLIKRIVAQLNAVVRQNAIVP